MKVIFVMVTVLIMFCKTSWSQTNCIIPAPQHIETLAGEFVFTSSTAIVAPAARASQADMFSESVMDLLGRKLSCSDRGKVSGNEVLMFWRGWKAESIGKAAADGFKIVSSPTTHCYFDYDYEKINTRKVFDFDPVPENSTREAAANYIGVQANFWSHIDRSENNIDKQLFPRILALSETAWTTPENRNWDQFRQAAERNTAYLKLKHVNVYKDESLKN